MGTVSLRVHPPLATEQKELGLLQMLDSASGAETPTSDMDGLGWRMHAQLLELTRYVGGRV